MSSAVDRLVQAYVMRHENACALKVWSVGFLFRAAILLDLLFYALLRGPLVFFSLLTLATSILLLLIVCFRLVTVLVACWGTPEIEVTQSELEQLIRENLPVYTILVPLYREANIADGIIRVLMSLDYPREKLDIKLLLESDDAETISAVEQVELGKEFDLITVPAGLPRTKPKACNYGLERATGKFLVIFDAEDRPEKDQLLKAVAAFERMPSKVVCIQAKLNYYNPRENFLTRCFALEYTAWFDLVLPGLQQLGGPIPLGGTSNHFQANVLREIGGWDPYNVAEDCDLGVRIAVAGYETRILNSTTWEEANTRAGNWIRQRSRWVKGYLQTHLVHTRSISQLVQRLGIWKAILFQLTVLGVALQQLLNLPCIAVLTVYSTMLTIDVAFGRDLWTVMAGSREEYRTAWKIVYYGAGEDSAWVVVSLVGFVFSLVMLFSNLIFVGINLIACRRRGYHDLWLVALLSPLYWILGSLAAWKGFFQLIHRPHYWEKTMHGLTNVSKNSPAG